MTSQYPVQVTQRNLLRPEGTLSAAATRPVARVRLIPLPASQLSHFSDLRIANLLTSLFLPREVRILKFQDPTVVLHCRWTQLRRALRYRRHRTSAAHKISTLNHQSTRDTLNQETSDFVVREDQQLIAQEPHHGCTISRSTSFSRAHNHYFVTRDRATHGTDTRS